MCDCTPREDSFDSRRERGGDRCVVTVRRRAVDQLPVEMPCADVNEFADDELMGVRAKRRAE